MICISIACSLQKASDWALFTESSTRRSGRTEPCRRTATATRYHSAARRPLDHAPLGALADRGRSEELGEWIGSFGGAESLAETFAAAGGPPHFFVSRACGFMHP